jgi:hypothetical protein
VFVLGGIFVGFALLSIAFDDAFVFLDILSNRSVAWWWGLVGKPTLPLGHRAGRSCRPCT